MEPERNTVRVVQPGTELVLQRALERGVVPDDERERRTVWQPGMAQDVGLKLERFGPPILELVSLLRRFL